jgi:hypothetical protein
MCSSEHNSQSEDRPRKREWTVPPAYLGVIAALLAFGAFGLLIGAPALGIAALILAFGPVVVRILHLAAAAKRGEPLPADEPAPVLPQQGAAPALEQAPPQTDPGLSPEHQCPHETAQP